MASSGLAENVIMGFLHIGKLSVEGYVIYAFCELVFIVLSGYLYILYFKPKNKSIAVFVYFMVYVLTMIPSTLPPLDIAGGDSIQLFGESLVIAGLGFVFYRFLIIPVSGISKFDNKTGNWPI